MRKMISDPPIQISWRQSFFEKLTGYMGRTALSHDEGLVLVERVSGIMSTSIHMMFVFTPLAVFWLDEIGVVLHKTLAKPWDAYHAAPRPARYVLEIHPIHIDQWQVGDRIEFHESN